MDLSHFTDEPLGVLYSVKQIFRDYRSEFDKPKGLWISVDGNDDWASWCRAENYPLRSRRYKIILTPEAKVLVLKTAEEIFEFTEHYGRHVYDRWHRQYIAWEVVAEEYQGIIIAPYQWRCRMQDETLWYYGWDCASGCIWNPDVITEVKEVLDLKQTG